jgi:hypothetical protein
MELRVSGFVETLITQHVHLLIFKLLGQRILSLSYLLLDVSNLSWLHLVPGHAARRAVEIIQHLLTIDMDEVPAWQIGVPIGGV